MSLMDFYITLLLLMFLKAPAVDVVAVGLADGRIILHNLRYDEVIMTYTQDWGMVTSISFRTGSVLLCFFSNILLCNRCIVHSMY